MIKKIQTGLKTFAKAKFTVVEGAKGDFLESHLALGAPKVRDE